MSKPGLLTLTIKDKSALYLAYMPFIKNGGLFIPTTRDSKLGDEVFLLLTLMDSAERLPVAGKVVWVTPRGAQGKRQQGIGVQFSPQDAVEFWDLTNRQDWHVCELQQRGTRSSSWVAGRYSTEEPSVHAFDGKASCDRYEMAQAPTRVGWAATFGATGRAPASLPSRATVRGDDHVTPSDDVITSISERAQSPLGQSSQVTTRPSAATATSNAAPRTSATPLMTADSVVVRRACSAGVCIVPSAQVSWLLLIAAVYFVVPIWWLIVSATMRRNATSSTREKPSAFSQASRYRSDGYKLSLLSASGLET